jgi:signal transduction histidine kinase
LDNPLARAVARIPLPIRVKQLFVSVTVAALLGLVAVLGLVALGQSNSRGAELRTLQQQGAYEQLLLTDAAHFEQAIVFRLASHPNETPARSDEQDLHPGFDPASYQRGFLSSLDQQIGNQYVRLCLDAGTCPDESGNTGCTTCTYRQFAPHQSLTLDAVAPALASDISLYRGLFTDITGSSGMKQAPFRSEFIQSRAVAASYVARLATLARKNQARASALVASNRRSYNHSRELLIGAGAGSLLLALALGLLLSDSLLVPLRRTQTRLATIAAGDFLGQLDVPNRDEIGALATDVNRMSDELQRLYQELETASRHKSDFLATMSHELRTPLNSIIGFSEVLQEQMFGTLNDHQLADVKEVLRAGEHLLLLINDVLDLAKIEAGKMELDLSQVAIPEVLQSAVSLHAERAGRAGIELSLTTAPEQITISADERRLRQVVFNLVSNAVKFTPTGGRVEISAQATNGRVEIAVADTGPGIPAGDLETIFEEFEQSSDGKTAEGTGLGLPLSRKLLELHGGRLWVESQPGHGSTFHVSLPTG